MLDARNSRKLLFRPGSTPSKQSYDLKYLNHMHFIFLLTTGMMVFSVALAFLRYQMCFEVDLAAILN